MQLNRIRTFAMPLRCLLVIFSMCCVFAAPIQSATAPQSTTPEVFDITIAPQAEAWRQFLKLNPSIRQELWKYQSARGMNLRHWAWEWRLGWLRACDLETVLPAWCRNIFEQAMSDKALVVRADAATRLGKRFEGSGNQWAANMLIKGFSNQANLRRGQPLYVQQRILYALRQIGGENNLSRAQKVASTHEQSREYWTRIKAAK